MLKFGKSMNIWRLRYIILNNQIHEKIFKIIIMAYLTLVDITNGMLKEKFIFVNASVKNKTWGGRGLQYGGVKKGCTSHLLCHSELKWQAYWMGIWRKYL